MAVSTGVGGAVLVGDGVGGAAHAASASAQVKHNRVLKVNTFTATRPIPLLPVPVWPCPLAAERQFRACLPLLTAERQFRVSYQA
jgi:hypothetical protein